MTTHTESTSHALTSEQRKALRRPDSFTSTTTGMFEAMGRNARGVLLVVAGVAVLIGIGVFMMQKRDQKQELAQAAFFSAQKSLEEELKAVSAKLTAELPKPAPKTGAKPGEAPAAPTVGIEEVLYKKLDADATFPKSIAAYQRVTEEFKGSRSAYEAELALGNLYLRHGDAAKAATWLKRAVEHAPSVAEKSMANMGLGAAEESAGRLKEAMDAYQGAQSSADQGVRGDALLATARAQELSRDLPKARATYDQIITQMPGTEAAKAAESAKALLE